MFFRRELFSLQERIRMAEKEHRTDYKKFARLKLLLTRSRAEGEDSATGKPFVCGTAKVLRRKPSELTQQNIEELNARQRHSGDRHATLVMQVSSLRWHTSIG